MGTEPDPERIWRPATFFGSGFEFSGKTGPGFGMYDGVYRM